MAEGNISPEFKLKNIDETRNYFLKKLIKITWRVKTKKTFVQLLIILSTFLFELLQLLDVFQFLLFFSLIVIPRGITRSAIGLKICTTTAGIKKYKSIIKKKKHDKIVLFAESKLSSIEIFISNALTDYIISHNEFILVNNVLE